MSPSLIPNNRFFENYSEAVVITKNDGAPLLVNQAFTKLTGFTIENIASDWLNQTQNVSSETDLIKSDNSILHAKISLSKITFTDQSEGRVYTVTDNSAMVLQTKKLIESNKEFEQFVYAASHDLQEPLRMITSYVQLIQKSIEKGNTENLNEFMSFVIESSVRMQSLINDLLQFSRVNRKGNIFAESDLNEIVQIAITHLAGQIKASDAEVIVHRMPVVYCDSAQILRLFQNLIDNALKFKTPGIKPEIQIFVEETEQEYVFIVKDNGIGIEKKFWDRVFIIFQRLHPRDEYEGTGIGLAVCKKIVERHGGNIWVNSEQGKGSSFHFTIKK